ncbi:4720_t:CDS:1, partial [Funneliformis geosporum]
MTNRRCIACEMSKSEEKFQHNGLVEFCKGCREGDTRDTNYRFRTIFYTYAKELFALRFPNPKFDIVNSVSVPNDRKGRAKMIKKVKENITEGLKHYKDKLERLENANSDSKQIKETYCNVLQLNSYYNV